MSYIHFPEDDEHVARVDAIQRELQALRILTSGHAAMVNEKVDRIQSRLAELSTPIRRGPIDTMESDERDPDAS